VQNALKPEFQQKEEKSESQVLRRFRNGIEEEKTYLDYTKNLLHHHLLILDFSKHHLL
jgi:hypothetical protein